MEKEEEFLKKKGLLKNGFKKFVIKGDFGICTLNDLLKEYTDQRLKERDEELKVIKGRALRVSNAFYDLKKENLYDLKEENEKLRQKLCRWEDESKFWFHCFNDHNPDECAKIVLGEYDDFLRINTNQE